MLFCPQCGTVEDIKWMIRHQKTSDEDTSTVGNVLTLLCTKCGFNQSVFIQDYLEDIFKDWVEIEDNPGVVPFDFRRK